MIEQIIMGEFIYVLISINWADCSCFLRFTIGLRLASSSLPCSWLLGRWWVLIFRRCFVFSWSSVYGSHFFLLFRDHSNRLLEHSSFSSWLIIRWECLCTLMLSCLLQYWKFQICLWSSTFSCFHIENMREGNHWGLIHHVQKASTSTSIESYLTAFSTLYDHSSALTSYVWWFFQVSARHPAWSHKSCFEAHHSFCLFHSVCFQQDRFALKCAFFSSIGQCQFIEGVFMLRGNARLYGQDYAWAFTLKSDRL